MAGTKENTFNLKYTLLLFFTCFFFACNKEHKKDTFSLIDRGSYSSRYVDGYQVFIKDNQVMNGYYVVGKELIKWEEFEVEKGLLNGNYITYHPNGEMSSKTTYVNGKMHGNEELYYNSGKLLKTVNYKNNKKIGEIKLYYEGGQIKKVSKIKNEKTIESIYYDNVGNIRSQMFIKDGLKITQYIIDGKVFSEKTISTYDDNESIKFYNEDGSLKQHLRMYEENSVPIIIELDSIGKEIKKINLEKNPEEAMKYMRLWNG